jgi:hypothetical protein
MAEDASGMARLAADKTGSRLFTWRPAYSELTRKLLTDLGIIEENCAYDFLCR